jgi:hypothetical protein
MIGFVLIDNQFFIYSFDELTNKLLEKKFSFKKNKNFKFMFNLKDNDLLKENIKQSAE